MPFDEKYFSSDTYQNVSFARYRQYWWSNRFYAILARHHARGGRRLLEVGSGLGHLAGQLEGSFQVFAADVNLWALRKSLGNAQHALHIASSAENIPFEDGAFDVVILKHVVEHLPHPETALAEVSRITASGGTLILSAPNLTSLMRPAKGAGWIGYRDPTHISLKEPGEWLEAMAKAGFTARRVFSDGFWDVPYVKHVPNAIQKLFFGAPGGLQALTGIPFLPLQWGETMIVIARKEKNAL